MYGNFIRECFAAKPWKEPFGRPARQKQIPGADELQHRSDPSITVTASPAKPMLRHLLRILFGYGLILFTCAYLAYFLLKNWSALRSVDWLGHPLLMGGHFGLLIGMFVLFTLGWVYLVRSTGFPLPLAEGAYSWLVPNLGKYLPGKVFMFTGRVEICHKLGMRHAAGLSAMGFEQILTVVSAMPAMVWAAMVKLDLTQDRNWVTLTLVSRTIRSNLRRGFAVMP